MSNKYLDLNGLTYYTEKVKDITDDLSDRIYNVENIGRFLSLWDCTTGLPTTEPTVPVYQYSVGSYFRVATVATGYHHALSISGNTTDLGTYSGTYSLSFTVDTQSSTQITTISSLIAALDDLTRYDASGSVVTTDATYTVTSVLKWTQDDVDYLALCDSNETKLALVLSSTSQTDTVTGGLINYRPDGSTYTGVASTVVETETVIVSSVYYWDGNVWVLQKAGGGGTVQDVQINGSTIISSGTGVANIPIATDSALGVLKGSSTYKLNINSDGEPNATTMTSSDYTSAQDNSFISKGTLENVLTAEALRVDGTAQTISSANQLQARTNIGAQAVLTTTIIV